MYNGINASELLQDEIAFNDGFGNFTLAQEILPSFNEATSKVISFDIDGDSDLDLL